MATINNSFTCYLHKFTFVSLCFFFIASQLVAQDSADLMRPPVWTKNQFLLSLGRLSAGNDMVDRYSNSFAANVDCSVTNTAVQNNDVYVDYESEYCGLYLENSHNKLRYSINGGMFRSGGGVFDSPIETFHGIFNFPNGSRGRLEENDYQASGTLSDGTKYNVPRTNLGIIDPQISLSYPVYRAANKILSLEGSTTIPISSKDFSLDRPDLKLNLVFESREETFSYLIGLSSIYHLDRNQNSIPIDNFSFGGFASLQYKIIDNLVLLVEPLIQSSQQSELPGFYDYEIYLDTGLRFKTFNTTLVDLILRENPSPGNGTADVSLILKLGF